MVIDEDILSAIAFSEHLDGNLIICVSQAYTFDCPLCSAGQVRLQILELFNVGEIGVSVYGGLIVLPKALPFTGLTGKDGYLKLWQIHAQTLCSWSTVSGGIFADELGVSSSDGVAGLVASPRKPL